MDKLTVVNLPEVNLLAPNHMWQNRLSEKMRQIMHFDKYRNFSKSTWFCQPCWFLPKSIPRVSRRVDYYKFKKGRIGDHAINTVVVILFTPHTLRICQVDWHRPNCFRWQMCTSPSIDVLRKFPSACAIHFPFPFPRPSIYSSSV